MDHSDCLIEDGVLKKYIGTAETVVIPEGVCKIGELAFVSASQHLSAVTLPEGLEEIGFCAFMHCQKLASVSVPQTVKRISDGAFYRCTSLTDIKLPEHAVIGDAAFVGCKQLADKNGFIIINGILFEYYGSLSEVVVPDGVTRISDLAFGCNCRLRRITLPETLKSIGCAIQHCPNLERIDWPKGKVSISNDAFRGCDRLTGQKRNETDD